MIIESFLDIFKVTEFEKSVLFEVQKIKIGKTANYSEIAERIGKPGAARAVGNALNKNPLPVIIPCHRVVSENGIGGYKYGVLAKRALLAAERGFGINPLSSKTQK